MLYAELDGASWAVIVTAGISAVFLGATQILTLMLADRRETAKLVREEIAAKLAAENAAILKKELAGVGAELKTTTLHINSMKDQLVSAVAGQSRAEGKEAGVVEERERLDALAKSKPALAPALRANVSGLSGASGAIQAVGKTAEATGVADDAAKEAARLASELAVATANAIQPEKG